MKRTQPALINHGKIGHLKERDMLMFLSYGYGTVIKNIVLHINELKADYKSTFPPLFAIDSDTTMNTSSGEWRQTISR